MVEVTGQVTAEKPKEDRNGNPYQGVSLKEIGTAKRYWFANYGKHVLRGDTVTVAAKSTAEGRGGMTFLNSAEIKAHGEAPVAPPAEREEAEKVSVSPPLAGHGGGAEHRVSEDSAALGTVDDLADGDDPASYGGVITFRRGTTKAEVETILRALGGVLRSSDVREYDPKMGSPVFYIP